MGTGYDHHSINHQHHHFDQKTIFLPLFCRLTIKDIKLNNRRKDPKSAADEPSSPTVSCMGQVKRSNRVIGFPPAAASSAVATHHHRYSKLKKLFSSKTLLPPNSSSVPTTTTGGGAAGGGRSGSKSCRSSRDHLFVNNSRRLKLKNNRCEQDCVKMVINVGELDPPLPVVKKVAPAGVGRDEVNIWKRRFNGATALESLKIERSQLPNSTSSLPPTV